MTVDKRTISILEKETIEKGDPNREISDASRVINPES